MGPVKILLLLSLVALTATSPTFHSHHGVGGLLGSISDTVGHVTGLVGRTKAGILGGIFAPHQKLGLLHSFKFLIKGIVSVKVKFAIGLFGKLAQRKHATSLSHVWNTVLIAVKASGDIIDAWSPGVGSLFIRLYFGFLKIGVCVLGRKSRSICKRSYGKHLGFKQYTGGYGRVSDVIVGLDLKNCKSSYLGLMEKNGHGDIESLTGTAKIVAKSILKLTLLLERGANEWKHEDLLIAYAELTFILGIFGKSCHKDLGLSVAVDFLEYAKPIFSSQKKWDLETYSVDIKTRITNAKTDTFYGILNKFEDSEAANNQEDSHEIDDEEDDEDSPNEETSEGGSQNSDTDSDSSPTSQSPQQSDSRQRKHKSKQTIYNAYRIFLRGIDRSKAKTSYAIFEHLALKGRATSMSQVWNHAVTTARGVGGILNIWSPGVGTLFNSLYIALVRIGVCVVSKSKRSVCNPSYGKKWGWKPYTKGYSSIDTVISDYELTDVDTKFTNMMKKNGHEIGSLKGSKKVIANSIKKLILLINRDTSSWKQEDLITIYAQLGLILGSLGASSHRDLGSSLVNQYFEYSRQAFQSQRNWDLKETITTITTTVTTTTETSTFIGINQIKDEDLSESDQDNSSITIADDTDVNNDEDDQDYNTNVDKKAPKGGKDTTPTDGDKPKDIESEDAGPKVTGPNDNGSDDAGSDDAGPKDAASKVTGSKDAGPKDAVPKVTGSKDAGPKVTGPKVTGPNDTESDDAGSADAGPKDDAPKVTGSKDAGPKVAGPNDTESKDAGPKDAGPKDDAPKVNGSKDGGPKVARPHDTGSNDAGPKDAKPNNAGHDNTGSNDAEANNTGSKAAKHSTDADTSEGGSQYTVIDSDSGNTDESPQEYYVVQETQIILPENYNAYRIFLKGIDKSTVANSYAIFKHLAGKSRATTMSQVWNHAVTTARGVGGILDAWSPGVGTLFNSLYIALVRIGVCVVSKSKRSVCNPSYGKKWGWKPYTKGYSSIDTVISDYELTDVDTKFTNMMKKNGHEINSLSGSKKVIANSIKKLILLINRDASSWKQEDLITIYGQLGVILGSLGTSTHRALGSLLVNQYFEYSREAFKSQRNWDLIDMSKTVTRTVTVTTSKDTTTTITGINPISDQVLSEPDKESSTDTGDKMDAGDDQDDEDCN